MGIPKFFRWMSGRYPLCSQLISQAFIPDFDNLYLDVNGIIHNCASTIDGSKLNQDDLFGMIFDYIEALFIKIAPKEVFFIAIDGVAPRAKMNQQRSRRFRSSKERLERDRKSKEKVSSFDSNCITPGTSFMHSLNSYLKHKISDAIQEKDVWKNCKVVVFSGSDVPGEGEHKIMEYIRELRSAKSYNSNTRHCLYGLDSDLIYLGLVLHEPHLALLREEISFGRGSRKNQSRHFDSTKFYLLYISLLREYLELEFSAYIGIERSIEAVIDDLVAFSLFIGNDFIPHIPHLHINQDAFGIIFSAYQSIDEIHGLNQLGCLNLLKLEKILNQMIWHEFNAFNETFHFHDFDENDTYQAIPLLYEDALDYFKNEIMNFCQDHSSFFWMSPLFISHCPFYSMLCDFSSKIGLEVIDDQTGRIILFKNTSFETSKYDFSCQPTTSTSTILSYFEWKRTYYQDKLQFDLSELKSHDFISNHQIKNCAQSFIQGLQWVLSYYYKGVPSWSWYFPHHYAPFISDISDYLAFCRISGAHALIDFDIGLPFKPFEQLMAVLPSASHSLVPGCLQTLMTDQSTSPIIDFYPEEFETDLNGKMNEWEAVVKIPFIDQGRLLDALNERSGRFSAKDIIQNQFGHTIQFTWSLSRDSAKVETVGL